VVKARVIKPLMCDDTTEVRILQHIYEHSEAIPVPRALGIITIGGWYYTFLSFVQGIPLDTIWADIAPDQRCHIRDQLNGIYEALRRLPQPAFLVVSS
jgi:hypothetical protein